MRTLSGTLLKDLAELGAKQGLKPWEIPGRTPVMARI